MHAAIGGTVQKNMALRVSGGELDDCRRQEEGYLAESGRVLQTRGETEGDKTRRWGWVDTKRVFTMKSGAGAAGRQMATSYNSESPLFIPLPACFGAKSLSS